MAESYECLDLLHGHGGLGLHKHWLTMLEKVGMEKGEGAGAGAKAAQAPWLRMWDKTRRERGGGLERKRNTTS